MERFEIIFTISCLFFHFYVNDVHNIHIQEKNTQCNDTIFWSEDVTLSWSDFQGKVDKSSSGLALSNTAFTINYVAYNGFETTIRLRSYFNKSKSWAFKDSVDENILRHELFHFHITEFCLRKLKKELINWKVTQNDFNLNYNNVIKKAYLNREELHNSYDEETNHSIDSLAQKKWEKNITDSLGIYSIYSRDDVTIKFVN